MLWLIDIEVAITHTKPFYGDRLVLGLCINIRFEPMLTMWKLIEMKMKKPNNTNEQT